MRGLRFDHKVWTLLYQVSKSEHVKYLSSSDRNLYQVRAVNLNMITYIVSI